MIVISDTSPVNYLILIREIDVLPRLFGTVILPQAVLAELQALASPEDVKEWLSELPEWALVRSAAEVDASIQLGAGEREAISLAHECNADLLLIDDKKARRTALERGFKVAGTINVLEVASKRGLVELADAFEALRKTSFRVDPALLAEILKNNLWS